MQAARVPLRVVGVPLKPPSERQKRVPGEDFPKGIEYLDLSWFTEQIGLDTLRDAKTDEELRVLRARATVYMELIELKAKLSMPEGG